MVGGVNYEQIDDAGLMVTYGDKRTDGTCIECDNVVLCVGQVPLRTLADDLLTQGRTLDTNLHIIGGALEAGELDAKRAIDQAARLAAQL